ncbi:uncharacterized protein EI90DRAFT_829615 [Cantharellus anzutake]|uniref:uncharacterized protein n=1 Tax=Cantharellus anzutake TaxID=1750568 RepID=UPI0019077B58|nr:uncharacterized protein EI90DRAFT_829615 [Cantharellus anzutake]KAF8343110.1 hypothetical protein EI90DRAFT_829615 [Cantharellus anzutake]
MATSNDIFFDLVREGEVEAAHEIEVQGFPPDEAGSLETFRYRQLNAPALFIGAFRPSPQPRTLLGYINATLSSETTLSHDSMFTHSPGGSTVCIHSVCVKSSITRQGIATQLLLNYIDRLEKDKTIEHVIVICHEELQRLYARVGFQLVGKSPVVHGSRDWFEMRKTLRNGTTFDGGLGSIIHEDLVQTLRKPTRSGSAAKLSSVHSIEEMTTEIDGKKTNKHALVCVKKDCSSLILRANVAELRESSSIEVRLLLLNAGTLNETVQMKLDPVPLSLPQELPKLPPSGETTSWWLITPNPMAFENIGFSRPVQTTSPRIRLLACAECDLGPVGWSLEGGNEFWVHPSRVGYRV